MARAHRNDNDRFCDAVSRAIHPSTETSYPYCAQGSSSPDTFGFVLLDGSVPARTRLASMIGDAAPPVIGYAAGLVAISTIGSSPD